MLSVTRLLLPCTHSGCGPHSLPVRSLRSCRPQSCSSHAAVPVALRTCVSRCLGVRCVCCTHLRALLARAYCVCTHAHVHAVDIRVSVQVHCSHPVRAPEHSTFRSVYSLRLLNFCYRLAKHFHVLAHHAHDIEVNYFLGNDVPTVLAWYSTFLMRIHVTILSLAVLPV